MRDAYCCGRSGVRGAAWDCLLLLGLFAPVFFLCLGRGPLMVPDEARYAEIPREMLESGDFVTPRLNYVKYFDKPPLHYWLTAGSFSLFGRSEFSARVIPALSGLLSILLVWHIGRKLYGRRAAMLASLVLGTSAGYVAQGRLNIIDMLLTLLMTAALGSFFLASREEAPRRGFYFMLFYAASALMVLAKGLIGIAIPAAIIGIYVLLRRRRGLVREMRLPAGVPLLLALCAPWFIAVSLRNPGFGWFFFIHEHFVRFASTHHNRYEPFWFFIPVLFGCMLPWTCFLPSLVAGSWRRVRSGHGEPDVFLWLWIAVIVVFFSASGSKLVPYILPAFPALSLLLGKTFADWLDGSGSFARRQAWFLVAALFCGGAGILLYPHLAPEPRLSVAACRVIGVLLFLEGMLALRAVRASDGRRLFSWVCASSYLLCLAGPTMVIDRIEESRSLKGLALLVNEHARGEDMLAGFDFYPQDLPFYTRRRVVLVEATGDLEYGSAQGDQSAWFIGFPAFYAIWDSPRRVFAVIHEDDMPTFGGGVRTPARELGRKDDILLISNR